MFSTHTLLKKWVGIVCFNHLEREIGVCKRELSPLADLFQQKVWSEQQASWLTAGGLLSLEEEMPLTQSIPPKRQTV